MDEDSIRSLSQNKILIAEVHENLNELESEFLKVQSLFIHPVTDVNFNAAITSFYKIFILVPLMKSRIDAKGMPMFRARPNEKKNILFSKEIDISYNSTDLSVIKAGRFNQPLQAVFYGSLPVENSKIPPEMVACLETCKGLTDPINPVYLKDFTIGRWQIQKPFYVVNLCFDEAHLKGNQPLKRAADEYLQIIRDCLTKESSKFVFKFLTYFSEMSGRRSLTNNEYYILTALLYAVKYYYWKEKNERVYGLIYPSAMTEAQGLNLVITTEAVDLFLKPDKVIMYRFLLDRIDKTTYTADKCSAMADIKDGEFQITNFIRIPEERRYE